MNGWRTVVWEMDLVPRFQRQLILLASDLRLLWSMLDFQGCEKLKKNSKQVVELMVGLALAGKPNEFLTLFQGFTAEKEVLREKKI